MILSNLQRIFLVNISKNDNWKDIIHDDNLKQIRDVLYHDNYTKKQQEVLQELREYYISITAIVPSMQVNLTDYEL